MITISRQGIGLSLLLGLVLLFGCRQKVVVDADSEVAVEPIQPKTSPFEIAIDFLNRLDEFEATQAHHQILYNLGEWVRQQPPAVEWIADPMYSKLPSKYEEAQHPEELAEQQFQQHDALVLQEAVWMRDIARSIVPRPTVDPLIASWLEELPASAEWTKDQVRDLALAERLFDWTVRNIQLDPPPAPPAARPSDKGGVPPRILYAWENLLLGHGTWQERSRVFILLARQQGLHVVMLAVDEEGTPRPWLPAVLIGNQLFLFDMALGVPVYTASGNGIATLEQVLSDPGLLRTFVGGESGYPIDEHDLDNLVALIDATPAHLSQRMKMVESRLTGDQKMIVTIRPTPLAVKLRTCRGINRVDLWTLPYDSYRFRRALLENTEATREAAAALLREHRPFERLSPLAQGRLLQFRGTFDRTDDEPGAKAYLLSARTPNAEIDKFDTQPDQLPESSPLFGRLPDDPEKRQAIVQELMQEAKRLAVVSKQHASYWLGLIAFDSGDYDVAIDYFQNRTLDASPDGPWTHGARYNLGRAQEAIGLRDQNRDALRKARDLYLADDDSPQALGNRIRARRIDAILKTL